MVRSVIFVVVMAFVVLIGGAGAMSAALDEGEERTDVENETFEPVGGETTGLEYSNVENANYDEEVTVVNETETFVDGTDYEWHDSNATITTIDNSSLDDSDTAQISYGFVKPSDEAVQLAGSLDSVMNAQAILLLAVAGLALIMSARTIGGI